MTDTRPIATGERMDALDAVRGVAVLGILLINVEALSGYGFRPPRDAPGMIFDPLVFFLLTVLVEGKFYALFSFLFGVGFAVFVQRAAARGADAVRLFKRRLTGLLLIGVLHAFLIWMGDILVTYAVLGFALVPFLEKDDRTVIRWAAALLLLPIVLYAVALVGVGIVGMPEQLGPAAATPGLPPILQQAVEKFAHGSYIDIVEGNAVFTGAQVVRRFLLMFFPRVFAMFLLGFYVGRRNMFADLEAHRPLLVRVFSLGMVIGLPAAFLGAGFARHGATLPDVRGLVETTLKSIAIPALSLGYAAGLCLLFQRFRTLRRAFAPVGRMALTNYLTHSIVGVAVFYGIGLGLFGQVSLTVALAGAVAFYTLQMVMSRIWLTHAAFGPAEWLWRMLTYRRRFPLKRGQAL